MKNRSYNQYCGLAYALDIVGERWTLLIVRELFAGPRRFKDLIDGLPDISTNLLTERLKSLERRGLLRRRVLPPPAGSMVYELTEGLGLEKTALELGRWGSQFVPPSAEGATVLHLGSYALTLKTFFRPGEAQGVDDTYELHVDDEVLQVRIIDGDIQVKRGEAPGADMVLHTDMPSYLGLLSGNLDADGAISTGLVRVEGDIGALSRLLRICRIGDSAAQQV